MIVCMWMWQDEVPLWRRRVNHVKTLMWSFSGTAPNGEATNQGTSLNVTSQVIVFPDTNVRDTSSHDLGPHQQNALKWLGTSHKTMDKIMVHVSVVHNNGALTASISFLHSLLAQETSSKSNIKDTVCSQATCFVTRIGNEDLMNELKKHWESENVIVFY